MPSLEGFFITMIILAVIGIGAIGYWIFNLIF